MIELWHFGIFMEGREKTINSMASLKTVQTLATKLAKVCLPDGRNYIGFDETFTKNITGSCKTVVDACIAHTVILVLDSEVRVKNQADLGALAAEWAKLLPLAVKDNSGNPMDVPGNASVALAAGYLGLVPERTAIMRLKMLTPHLTGKWVDFRGHSLDDAILEAKKALLGEASYMIEKPGKRLMRVKAAGGTHAVEQAAKRIEMANKLK